MTEWQVFLVLAGVFAFLVAVVTPLLKLNTGITELSCAVKSIKDYLIKNDECHADYSLKLADHETRIRLIEAIREDK